MPKLQAELTAAGKEFRKDFTLMPNWGNFQNHCELADSVLVLTENIVDQVSHGGLAARVRAEWVDPDLDDADVEAIEGGFLYYDKETFPQDGDSAYRVVQSGSNDSVNATQSYTLSYPTYGKPDYANGNGIQQKSRVTFGQIKDIPPNP